MVDFSLSDEERQIRDTVRAFIEREVMPLEPEVLRSERAGRPGIDRDVLRELQLKARRSGFWGVTTPEEYGGMNLGAVMSAIIAMESGRTFVPFSFGGYADNILYAGNDEQKQRYLIPTIEGERISCFAITEPGAGSDARSIRTSARPDGGDYVINGEKTFITNGNEADFVMVFAVVPDVGVTCFLVDRDMGAYCVSKAGVDMLVKIAAAEWGSYGIRVNAVGPGVTRTPMLADAARLPGWVDGLCERTPLGRLGEAADVAGAIIGVLELDWVTGQVVFADGGLALHSPIDAYGQMQRLQARRRE